MRHGVSKKTFGYGVDSNQMLLRKLVTNFVTHGKLTTTKQKAQFMRPSVDRLVSHAKSDTTASLNVLKSFFGSDVIARSLQSIVRSSFQDRSSGFTKTVTIGQRSSDAATMVQVTWSSPVVLPSAASAPVKNIKKTITEPTKEKATKQPKSKVTAKKQK